MGKWATKLEANAMEIGFVFQMDMNLMAGPRGPE